MALPIYKLLQVLAASGFTYYVDSALGNDANTGRSPAQAFASFAPLNAMGTLTAGSSIGIARGSVVRDSLSLGGDSITIDAYGSGALPLLDCSDVLSDGGWTKTAGRTNVYERTITLPGDSKALGNVWADDAFLAQVTTVALCDSTPGSAYVTSWTASSATLYVHAPASAVPGADGKVYSYSRRLHAVYLTGNGCHIKRVRARRNAHQDGSIRLPGENCLGTEFRAEDGCRHAALFGPGCLLTDAYFYRARNDLEAPGTANTLVVNAASITGKSYRTLRCAFDAGDQPNVTGPQNHGANANDLFAQVVHDAPVFIGLTQCWDVGAADYQVTSPTFTNCGTGGVLGRLNGYSTVSGGVGTINRLYSAEIAGTVRSRNNVLSVPMLDAGFYKSEAVSGDVAIDIDGDTINVLASSSTNDLIRCARGSVVYTNLTFGPTLANPSTVFVRAGYSSQTATVAGSNSQLPYGSTWIINGVTTSTIAARQAAGQDAGSTYGVIAQSFSDEFNRADENLEVSGSWSRIGGSAAQAAVRSNQLAHIGTTQTLYAAPALSGADHYARATVQGIPATANSFPLAVRAADQSNFVGLRWNATGWQIWRCVAGTLGQFSTASVAPAIGDQVILAVRGDAAWLYVNGAAVAAKAVMSATAIGSNVRAGTIPRSGALTPAVDSFACGVA